MGGIVGWIGRRPQAREDTSHPTHIERMAEAVVHRGCAHYGLWEGRRCALAQAPGPAVHTVTHNGATFTAVCDSLLGAPGLLRKNLSQRGYRFGGESEAELILATYLLEGEDCVHSLSGSFAFLIWDGAQQRAFAVRDPFGTRPLFYTSTDEAILFASEIKGLFAHPDCTPALDASGLREILGIGPGRTPGHGVFKGVHELPPGGCLRVDADGLHPRTWYQLNSLEHTDTLEDTIEHTRSLLLSSIRRQWPTDSGACAFLSGGLDSSIITAVTAGLCGHPLRTFSFDYMDNAAHFRATSFQPEADAPYVQKVRAHCGTNHQILLCDSSDLTGTLENAMRARDLPGMADVDASLLYFCGQVAATGERIAFSGECADEIFGGYPWFHREEFFTAQTFPWNTDPSTRRRVLNTELAETLQLDDYVQERYARMLAQVPRLQGENAQEARRREIAYMNLYGFMATLVDRGDRMSAAAGLEIRTPFCDPALIEYVFNVPWEFKALGGEPKGLLRAAAKGLLPEDILHRRKSPFPKTHNPQYEQLVQTRVREVLADPNAPVRALLQVPVVESLCGEHADYGKPWFGQLMAGPQLLAWILQVNAWMERYGLSV